MMVQTVSTDYTVTDYCAAMDRREIVANREYQRSDRVWPPAARSFLIETILLGYPIPKIYLRQITDVKSRKAIKEIVDGQQRSGTIHDFFHNKLKLSKSSEIETAGGKSYDQLDDELKARFLDYRLSTDLFVSASDAQIRETFRRLNSYTVPLNPEEKRHAEYQGAFKWFVYELMREYEEALLSIGVLTEKQVIRMADTKLLAEFTYAIHHGVTTTKSRDLDRLYKENDRAFSGEPEIRRRFQDAMDWVISLPEIHNGPLMKPHIFYSLLIAMSHIRQPADLIATVFEAPADYRFDREAVVTNLTSMAQALDDEIPAERFLDFVAACSEKTNVESQRKRRVMWLGMALRPELL